MAFHYPDHAPAMDPATAAVAGVGAAVNPKLRVPGRRRRRGRRGDWEPKKAAIAAHPLYERLLEAHVACLRIATPVDQLPRIDTQIADWRRAARAGAAGLSLCPCCRVVYRKRCELFPIVCQLLD
ncbi:homeobox protein knotted-1-like 2 isoform X2 [Panicum miliaceum]|uniref:Homeobox protein knotted-1-like 2 isoform X2 n=1 Tax=Panicum miliaceum TaxID=4540 RepID=A0A3L6RUK0_PANMI|nr:homeobox protein knotted-1-like 2 isoform X2 [Panicum miliaceum]